jgi:hypothetical protein
MDVKVLQRRYAKCICILDYFVVMSRIKYYNNLLFIKSNNLSFFFKLLFVMNKICLLNITMR